MIDKDFRKLNEIETRILNKITEIEIPHMKKIRSQIEVANVKTVDEFGSISFEYGHGPRVDAPDGPLVNATQSHAFSVENYGPFINYIIFLKDGYIKELQIYKDDGGQTINLIDPEKIFDVF